MKKHRLISILILAMIITAQAQQKTEQKIAFLGFDSESFDTVQHSWFRDGIIRKSLIHEKNVFRPMTVASIIHNYNLYEIFPPGKQTMLTIARDLNADIIVTGFLERQEDRLFCRLTAFVHKTESYYETFFSIENNSDLIIIEQQITEGCYNKLFTDRGWLVP